MGKSGKKPRQKMSPQRAESGSKSEKKERDWGFEDIARSKGRGSRTW